jgi:hypothetical protein
MLYICIGFEIFNEMNFKTDNQTENIETAKRILFDLGIIDVTYSGYSDTNGVSVYYKTKTGLKCRVSDHTIMNRGRMNEELSVSFDEKQLGLGGKISEKNNFEINKLMVKRFIV